VPTVLITDYTFPDISVESILLQPAGLKVIGRQCKTPEQCQEATAEADYIITQFAPINASVIERMNRAKIIVRYGIGVDNVDLDAAKLKNIPVCNVPDYCIDEVADHTLAFILAATRQIFAHANSIRSNAWKLATPVSGFRAMKEQTVGVVGFGRIGREVVQRLLAFKARVIVFDPVVAKSEIESAGATPMSTFDELLGEADVITLHCPSNAKTRKMINAQSIAKARQGFILVNVARGDLVDTDAMVEAINSGQMGMAMLDVSDPEPPPLDHPLRTLPNVVMAPHVASVSPNAVRRLRESVARHVLRAHRGEALVNVVNGVVR